MYYATILVVKRTKKTKLLFLLISIICTFKYADHLISFGTTPPDNAIELKVLTWNVQRLGALSETENSAENLKYLSKILSSSKADVVILQEISQKQTLQLLSYLNLKLENQKWTNYFQGSKGGLALLLLGNKDWAISNKMATNLPPSWKCLYSELKHRTGQKINIFGVHITPPKVIDTEVKKVTKKLLLGKRSGIRKILRRYIRQAKMQTRQVDKVNELVGTFSDPTIIAGDFNSTSQLPIHKELRANLYDTWLEGGNGIGSTRHWAKFLPFRIDYIYASKKFGIVTTEVENSEFSDHNPVITSLFINQ